MKKYSFLLAVFLGLVLPWILFSGKEVSMDSPETTLPQSTLAPADTYRELIAVSFSDSTVKELELEDYILGVLIGEMPADFELEALKAQAVVARTFAVKSMRAGYKHADCDLCTDSSCCQNYYDPAAYVADGGTVDKFQQAVELTRGQVLLYNGELIEATYFSCSGGKTEDAQAVWGTDIPYLQAIESPGEENATHFMDTVTFSAAEFQTMLGQELSGVPGSWIGRATYTDGGGVASIEIGKTVYTGTQLRQKLDLYSTAFVISAVGEHITVTTKGFGHRVGMSQYGADAMAVQGKTYEEILSYYYRGTFMDSYRNV